MFYLLLLPLGRSAATLTTLAGRFGFAPSGRCQVPAISRARDPRDRQVHPSGQSDHASLLYHHVCCSQQRSAISEQQHAHLRGAAAHRAAPCSSDGKILRIRRGGAAPADTRQREPPLLTTTSGRRCCCGLQCDKSTHCHVWQISEYSISLLCVETIRRSRGIPCSMCMRVITPTRRVRVNACVHAAPHVDARWPRRPSSCSGAQSPRENPGHLLVYR